MTPTAPLEKRLRPRRTPRQARSAETRARILDAASEVFATHGYAAGTTNRIADASGLSVGSLYQYFPNKDAILVELVRAHIDEGTRETLEALAGWTGDTDDPVELVRAVITAMVGVHVGDRRLHQVLFEESPRPPSLLRELAALEDDVVALVTDSLRASYPDLDDPALSARLVVVTIESLVHRFVASDRPLDTERFIAEATRMVGGYLADLGSTRQPLG
jgi:AcrR family transcriptional regulator